MPDDAPAFFLPADGEFEPTELTRGPWDPGSQHAGPPAALLARELERCPDGAEGEPEQVAGRWILGRVTYEILRPVPIAPLRVEAAIVRPGRRVQMLEGELRDAEDETLVRARGWRLRRGQVELPPALSSESEDGPARAAGRPSGGLGQPPGVDEAEEGAAFFPGAQPVGYHTAMEYRFAGGGFVEPGPAIVWMRMRQSLVAGEEPTPLQRVLVAADSGNGVSATLDFRRYLFINVDLTVHLHRMPAGEWVCLDALTIPEPTGAGIADAALYDERGPIGRAVQTLLIAER